MAVTFDLLQNLSYDARLGLSKKNVLRSYVSYALQLFLSLPRYLDIREVVAPTPGRLTLFLNLDRCRTGLYYCFSVSVYLVNRLLLISSPDTPFFLVMLQTLFQHCYIMILVRSFLPVCFLWVYPSVLCVKLYWLEKTSRSVDLMATDSKTEPWTSRHWAIVANDMASIKHTHLTWTPALGRGTKGSHSGTDTSLV